jgi:hypothetical protein
MRRLTAGAALVILTALVPLCVRADDARATISYAVPASITLPHFEHDSQPPRVPERAILYALQIFDAVQTGAALRRHGRFEQNPTVRPFARAGTLGIALGFALGDLARDRALRHAPAALRSSVSDLQALANLDGILTTQQSFRAP